MIFTSRKGHTLSSIRLPAWATELILTAVKLHLVFVAALYIYTYIKNILFLIFIYLYIFYISLVGSRLFLFTRHWWNSRQFLFLYSIPNKEKSSTLWSVCPLWGPHGILFALQSYPQFPAPWKIFLSLPAL